MLIQQSHHPSKINKMSTYHILFHLLADPLTQVMTSVINSKGQEVEDFNAINNEVCNFYKSLYSSKEDHIQNVDLNTFEYSHQTHLNLVMRNQ